MVCARHDSDDRVRETRYTPKKKLPIQVTNIDGVHVDHMNILETGQGEICKDFTTQTARSDDKDFALIAEKSLDLIVAEYKYIGDSIS